MQNQKGSQEGLLSGRPILSRTSLTHFSFFEKDIKEKGLYMELDKDEEQSKDL